MTPDPASSEPIITGAALERVLARATELQAASADAPEGITESRLVEIGREVGIPADHLRLALAEERSRVAGDEPQHGVLLDGLGTSVVFAQRAVAGAPGELLATIDTWMKREEMLEPNRRTPQRMSWSPRVGPLHYLQHVLTTGGRKVELVRADQVSATVTPVDGERSVVRLDADLRSIRRSQRNIMIGVGIVGNAVVFVGLSIPLLFVASIIPGEGSSSLLGAAVAVLGGAQALAGFGLWRALKRSYRRSVARMQERLEHLLDDLEHGNMVARPSLLGQLRDSMLEAVKPIRSINPPRN